MNNLNAVLAPATTPPTSSQLGAVRGNGSATTTAHHHHNKTPTAATSNEGYTQLSGQRGSSSSCSSSSTVSSSESEQDLRQNRHSTRLSFPRGISDHLDTSPCSSEGDFERGAVGGGGGGGGGRNFPSDKTDCKYSNCLSSEEANTSSSSSLNLSNPNINAGQYSSGDFEAAQYSLYSVQSLEHDLDCILENRDLNPFYEESAARGGGLSKDLRMAPEEEEEDDDCEFNVEDYLVDLDQYLEEQEGRSDTVDQNNLDQRIILRKPNTNRTLPRNHLRDTTTTSALKRDAAIRNSVHLGPMGKEPIGELKN